MRCFVTGGTGQIGSALVRALLVAGHDVRVLVLPRDPWARAAIGALDVALVTGDVLDRETLPEERFDWVFHLAADQSFWRGDERRQRAVNVGGVANMLAWARARNSARFVHVSSLLAVGVAAEPHEVMNERTSFNGADLGLMYAQTKHEGEALVRAASEKGLPAVIVNPGTVVGPWDHGRHVLRMLRSLISGPLRGFAPGGNNIVDPRDVAAGMIAAAERGQVGQRYLLTGRNLTYRELGIAVARAAGAPPPRLRYPSSMLRAVAAILDPLGRATGRRPPLTPDDVTVGCGFAYYDNARARDELGFTARPLDETISDAVAWYRKAGLWA